jgi:hypothetical protein
MSDKTETTLEQPPTPINNVEEPPAERAGTLDLPAGWMYRTRKIGRTVLPWYASPKIQNFMVSFVCFFSVGMYQALQGLGGGGKANATLADQMVFGPLHSW